MNAAQPVGARRRLTAARPARPIAHKDMNALLCSGYGSTGRMQVRTVPRPAVRSGEILVHMVAASVQSGDWRLQSLTLPRGMSLLGRLILGISKPRRPVLGTELSGIVEMVAPDVTAFKPGDAVIVALGLGMGAHAEYVSVLADGAVIKKPERLSFTEAACASFGGLTALHFLKYRARLRPGESILIIGASGAVGHACVQIAKKLGAHITATCSPEHRSFVKRMGASETIDRNQFDPARLHKRFDVIVDAHGALSMQDGFRLLKDDGRLVLLTAGLFEMLWSPVHNMFSRRRLVTGTTPNSRRLLIELGTMMENGTFTPAVDTVFPMNQAEAAFRHVAARSKKGSIVITS